MYGWERTTVLFNRYGKRKDNPLMNKLIERMRTVVTYLTSGQFVVDLVRGLVKTAGNIAESAFLLATVYVTINNVAHLLVTWIFPPLWIAVANQISVIAFSVLPELIVASAILVCYDHWSIYYQTKRQDAFVWSCAYTLPTVVFAVMTVVTLSSFVDVQATANISPTATGIMLVVRCLAGWMYGLTQMIYAQRGKSGYASHIKKLKGDVDNLKGEVSLAKGEVSLLKKKLSRSKVDVKSHPHLTQVI
jgi:hypothetical protein